MINFLQIVVLFGHIFLLCIQVNGAGSRFVLKRTLASLHILDSNILHSSFNNETHGRGSKGSASASSHRWEQNRHGSTHPAIIAPVLNADQSLFSAPLFCRRAPSFPAREHTLPSISAGRTCPMPDDVFFESTGWPRVTWQNGEAHQWVDAACCPRSASATSHWSIQKACCMQIHTHMYTPRNPLDSASALGILLSNKCTCACMRVRACELVCLCVCECICVCVCVSMSVRGVCVRERVCACVWIFLFLCVYACLCAWLCVHTRLRCASQTVNTVFLSRALTLANIRTHTHAHIAALW